MISMYSGSAIENRWLFKAFILEIQHTLQLLRSIKLPCMPRTKERRWYCLFQKKKKPCCLKWMTNEDCNRASAAQRCWYIFLFGGNKTTFADNVDLSWEMSFYEHTCLETSNFTERILFCFFTYIIKIVMVAHFIKELSPALSSWCLNLLPIFRCTEMVAWFSITW